MRLASVAPLLLVLLWSTGFVGAKFGLPYAEPFTFLWVRMVIVAGLPLVLAIVVRRRNWALNSSRRYRRDTGLVDQGGAYASRCTRLCKTSSTAAPSAPCGALRSTGSSALSPSANKPSATCWA